jgi:hypothetical protein
MKPQISEFLLILARYCVLSVLVCGCEEIGPGNPYVYGPASPSPNMPSSYVVLPTVSTDAQADYNRALADYNAALAAFNAASAVSGLENANWANQQNAAPGIGKVLAFGGAAVGNANRDEAARQLEIARQRLEVARQRLVVGQ